MSDQERSEAEGDQKVLSAELLSELYDSDETRQFPLEILPEPVREFVQQQAKALHTPVDFVAGPLLVALGATIGRHRLLRIKEGYEVAPALWLIVVASSGSAKSPALDKATGFLQPFDNEFGRLVVSDTTVEALAPLLMNNPRGLILVMDEIAGLLAGLNQYRSGRGGDEQKFLSLWSGQKIVIDRKGEMVPTIVENPFLAITGTVPLSPLAALVNKDRILSGLAPRFLICYPDRKPRRYTEDVVDESVLTRMGKLFGDLRSIKQQTVKIGATAKRKWLECATRNCDEINHLPDELRAVWSKLESYAGRLILILHAIKEVTDKAASEVAASTVEEGWALVRYFKAHAWRVYHMLGVVGQPSHVGAAQKLRAWIARHPEKTEIATRDVLAARIPGIRNVGAAQAYLIKLVIDGVLRISGNGKKFLPVTPDEGKGGPATQQVSNSADISAEGPAGAEDGLGVK